jgi:deoxycytidine triphosphate deaminase
VSQLVDHQISQLVRSDRLIEHYDEAGLQGGSYDMRLGARYAADGEEGRLTEDRPTIIVEPGAFAVLTTVEVLHLPQNLVGRVGLVGPVAVQGLISLITPQIDPGFSGFLIIPVFNGGDEAIALVVNYRYFTIEFSRTEAPAKRNWALQHGAITDLDQSWMRIPRKSGGLAVLRERVAFLKTDLSGVQKDITKQSAHAESFEQVTRAELKTLDQRLNARLDAAVARVDELYRKESHGVQLKILWIGLVGALVAVLTLAATLFALRTQTPALSDFPGSQKPAAVTRSPGK